MELTSRWMWQTGDEWLDTACLAIYFREALGNLRMIPVPATDVDDPLLESASSSSSNVSDNIEYADRVINASNGVWATDNTRKSRRAKRAPVHDTCTVIYWNSERGAVTRRVCRSR